MEASFHTNMEANSGLVLIIILGIIAGYTGYVIGQFKIKYPNVNSMADAGMIVFGPLGRELLGFGQLVVLIFIAAAHITSFTIMMNVLTGHSMCSILFSIMALGLSIILTLPRRLEEMSYLCFLCKIPPLHYPFQYSANM
jgi:hypothetical protein